LRSVQVSSSVLCRADKVGSLQQAVVTGCGNSTSRDILELLSDLPRSMESQHIPVPVICLYFGAIGQMEWKPMDALVSSESPVCAHSRPFPIVSALQLLPVVFSRSSVHPAICSMWNLPVPLSATSQNGDS
jgi:hypothetical protein